ncbi:hypothetical protein VB796_05360 [Arcicella sp. LKC2W]|uniref:hypothetical protein n=1 Tax=Arcicella sp. LKC2W TaxID=2984198 RepID=UPI002B2149B8|nr:hypothetical protein [Arcicella sp. LKC2W]MEA5458454.1 hypothetical protein [Arcicella sp. LKC2W]
MKVKKTQLEEFKSLKEFTKKQFLENQSEDLLVSEKEQQDELMMLTTGLRYEQFFFIVNVSDFSIVYAKGLEEIGYHSDNFDMIQYVQAIPSPGILQLMSLMWRKIFEFNMEAKTLLAFLKPKFIVQLPFKNSQGELMLVKRTISPFQFTSDGKLLQYLSEFTVIKKGFNNEAPEPRFTDIPPDLVDKYNVFINRAFIWENSPFSPKEMIILQAYASDTENKSLDEFAKVTEVTASTLKFYNKEIINKAKEYFGEHYTFSTAKEVAHFLNRCGVLN